MSFHGSWVAVLRRALFDGCRLGFSATSESVAASVETVERCSFKILSGTALAAGFFVTRKPVASAIPLKVSAIWLTLSGSPTCHPHPCPLTPPDSFFRAEARGMSQVRLV